DFGIALEQQDAVREVDVEQAGGLARRARGVERTLVRLRVRQLGVARAVGLDAAVAVREDELPVEDGVMDREFAEVRGLDGAAAAEGGEDERVCRDTLDELRGVLADLRRLLDARGADDAEPVVGG